MTSQAALQVVIAGGGTGGHLYPGLAVARELLARRSGARVSFVGTSRGLEARVVPREGFALDVIRSVGLKGMSIASRLRGVLTLPLSLLDAWRILSARRPHLVIGVGGYSSGPVVLVAALRGIPTMVLEQNAVPGLTNRLLAPMVRAAAVTHESTLVYFGAKGFVSGNPVRREFLQPTEGAGGEDHERVTSGVQILVVGGSQGSHAVNLAMMAAARELAASGARLHVTHQTGERDEEIVRTAYREAGITADVAPFLDDMDTRLRHADLVVCRSGATTLAEVTATGRAAILIPLPTATDDHQRKNAEALAAAGAAEVLPQQEATGPELGRRILALAADPAARRRMALAARGVARPNAAKTIVDRALALVGAES
jgi:UDP-N-acetylglucosamine--N-acetylmuramyl-(pentapeptide) pyrophosphoryl-undecaprenol N-acetylglucosamine transferase